MGEPTVTDWIEQVTPGRTFVDVGGLWGTLNEQVSTASLSGATATTMIDMAPAEGDDDLWQRMQHRVAERGAAQPTCVMGSIDDLELPDRVGTFDVVHCSGVLYHCPSPLYTLQQLRRLTRETLILGSATIPPSLQTSSGTLNSPPGSAILVPAMADEHRQILADWLREVGAFEAIGITAGLDIDWSPQDYAAWWWFFTVDCVSAMLSVVGFDVLRVMTYWSGRATYFLARVSGAP